MISQEAGYLMVDPQPFNQPVMSDIETIYFHHIGDRCFHHRLGGLLSKDRYEDRGTIVSQRPEKSHQLAGASRSFLGSPEFCSKERVNPCSFDDGQSSSHIVHHQAGRNTLSEAIQSCPGALELVHPEINNSACRTCSRSAECNSRLWDQTLQRFQWLKTGPITVSGSESDVQTVYSIPVCLLHECRWRCSSVSYATDL